MLYSQYNDSRLMFVHRSDRHPSNDDFVEMYLNSCEIILPISGNVSFLSEGTIYTPGFGDVMIFSPYELHKTIVNSDTPYNRIVIQIRSETFEKDSDYNKLFSFFKNLQFGKIGMLKKEHLQNTEIPQYIDGLKKISTDSTEEIIPLLFPFLDELKTAIENGIVTNEPQKKEIANAIIKYINDNLSQDLAPDLIADKFHISRSKLDKMFRERFDTSVWNYITRKRIKYAKSLLKTGKKPTKVAVMCGFNDYTTFFKAYKSRCGVSPKEDMINKKSSL